MGTIKSRGRRTKKSKSKAGGSSFEDFDVLVMNKLRGQRAGVRTDNGKFIVTNLETGKLTLSANFKVAGWVEQNTNDVKTSNGLVYWFNMCRGLSELDGKGTLPSIPAVSFRPFFKHFNPVFDDTIRHGLAPVIPLQQAIFPLQKALMQLGYRGFTKFPRTEASDWFVVLKDVKWGP